jgi:hypothetical protein
MGNTIITGPTIDGEGHQKNTRSAKIGHHTTTSQQFQSEECHNMPNLAVVP